MAIAQHKITRLPLTDASRLVGVITRADLLRVYTQTDAVIEAAVRRGPARTTP